MSWLNKSRSKIHTAATYNLLFNASLMVEEGLGYAFALDKIIHVTENSCLLFKPLSPAVHAEMNLIWKKYQFFSKAAQKFLEEITSVAAGQS